MKPTVSIAIETSCRQGGVALGLEGRLAKTIGFDASARHATQLVRRLADLLAEAAVKPTDLDELYVSVGPGSFTGLRVGITVARTLGQLLPSLRCVAVPTPLAVAQNARDLPWEHLAVVLDARDGYIHASLFARSDEQIVPNGPPAVVPVSEFLASAPRPLTLIGEGLNYHDCRGDGVTPADSARRLPTPAGVWYAGALMARRRRFTDARTLLPVYAHNPEAARLWKKENS